MCITFFILNPSPSIKFIIGFNRDQNTQRKTLPFGQFSDDENLYAGRDLESGGTWLGINVKTGIMVILTNYRLFIARKAKSRGLLVKKFLQTNYVSTQELNRSQQISNKIKNDLKSIIIKPQEYSAFNISVYNIRDNKIFYVCSQIKMKQPLVLQSNEVYGYSNTDINTKWFKVLRGKQMFQKIHDRLQKDQEMTNKQIFQLMQSAMKNTQEQKGFFSRFQSSIFINPYYSWYLRCNRMTKSTLYGIFRETSQNDKKIQAEIKQVTYNSTNKESITEFKLKI